MKEETRGIIEKAIDHLKFGFKGLEAIQEITPIENEEEFMFGYTLGYLWRYCEVVVLMQEENMTKTNEIEIKKIIYSRIPEIRKKLLQYLNK